MFRYITRKHYIVILMFIIFMTLLMVPYSRNAVTQTASAATSPAEYYNRFMQLFNNIQTSGYLSPEGIPYYAVETLIMDGPDYGHMSTSDTFGYMTWLAATYGKITGDWSFYKNAWSKTEQYIIPSLADQPGVEAYSPNNPSPYAPEGDLPSDYPVSWSSTSTGIDPIGNELNASYGSKAIYQMHWLLDVDNWYKYGNRGDGTSRCGYINTYDRGSNESVLETIPHPCWDHFKWGAGASAGFLTLFGDFGMPATPQWRYTTDGGADARQVQASYWAYLWTREQGKEAEISAYTSKAAKLGDFLRYSMFDKYFKPIGIQNGTTPGTGYDSCHYLIAKQISWGADIAATKSWRTGCSQVHQGYQNPIAAYALANDTAFTPLSSNAKADWTKAIQRQVELFQYLQSAEGAIAGGVTNSWQGKYMPYPAGISTFYNMAYDMDPVYHDPPGNMWFGYQTWSMERIMEYYYLTGDLKVKTVADKWVTWAVAQVTLNNDRTYRIPSSLSWSGQPEIWTGTAKNNLNLHCTVTDWTNDVGVAASLAKVLFYYNQATLKWTGVSDSIAKETAAQLLDRMWLLYRDSIGVACDEPRSDYWRVFQQEVYVPSNYNGITPQGAALKSGVKFVDIRPAYKNDPDYPKLLNAYNTDTVPVFKYHRFWAQAEIAMANGLFYIFSMVPTPPPPRNTPTPVLMPTPVPTITPRITDTPVRTATPSRTVTPRKTATPRRTATPRSIVTPRITATPVRSATPRITPTLTPVLTPGPTATTTAIPTIVVTAMPTSTPSVGGIKVQMFNSNRSATTNTISVQFKLINTGATALTLSNVKLRYYYTIDGETAQSFWCDYSTVGSANVTGSFIKMATVKSNADYYLEVGFTSSAVTLAPGAAAEIQTRFAKNNWSNYTQTNDYSFNASATSYADWTMVTAYLTGALQWGIEP